MGKRKTGRRRAAGRASRRASWRWRAGAAAVVVGAAAAAWVAWPFWELSRQLENRAGAVPSRLYGVPDRLAVGEPVRLSDLLDGLDRLGYRQAADRSPGTYRIDGTGGWIHVRATPTTRGRRPSGVVDLGLAGGRVRRLTWQGEPVGAVTLEAPQLGAYYGPDRRDRRPARLEDLPEVLVQAVLAAEDQSFFEHAGLSLRGIARAAWVNLKGGALRQGGSTLTQQLVKNVFLTHERTLGRKAREAILALFVDGRYSKRAILDAYLNEIYWGQRDGASLMGVGAAAWAYFGKTPEQLDLCESALLAGMIRSPGSYDPARHPEEARARRDWVLDRMVALERIAEGTAIAEKARPLCHAPHPGGPQDAPFFADAVRREAAERFGIEDLEHGGWTLLSTLDPAAQAAAVEAVAWGLPELETIYEKDSPARGPLQAALVSVDPGDGSIRAYVGGRDYGESQFDRAGQALRQAGSAFKPVVYLTAFERRVATPATVVEDEPLSVRLATATWEPRNSDGRFRGWVTTREALEDSLNVPTARLALATGLPEILAKARDLGVSTELEPYPALALGAFEVRPIELAGVYATLASGGVRHPLHGLRGVLAATGEAVRGAPLPESRRVAEEGAVYVLNRVLQGVLDEGTAASAGKHGVRGPWAGKTGTTNDRRDSWFAGYGPREATLVWVGYDDNAETRLSGARAGLPIWARFVGRTGDAPGSFAQPPGVATATIDPLSGLLATGRCPGWRTEAFVDGTVPSQLCPLHGGGAVRAWDRDRLRRPEADEARRRGLWRWLGRVLGRDDDRPRDGGDGPPDG